MRSMAEGGREGVGCGSPKVEWHMGEWKNPFPTQEMSSRRSQVSAWGPQSRYSFKSSNAACLSKVLGPGRREK